LSRWREIKSVSSPGLDMPGTVNLFFVLRSGLPFAVEMPRYSQNVLGAMYEAGRISRAPDVSGYTDMEALKNALEE